MAASEHGSMEGSSMLMDGMLPLLPRSRDFERPKSDIVDNLQGCPGVHCCSQHKEAERSRVRRCCTSWCRALKLTLNHVAAGSSSEYV